MVQGRRGGTRRRDRLRAGARVGLRHALRGMEAETPERGLARAGGEVPGVASRPLTPAPDAVFARALEELRGCRVCAAHLPLGPRPVARLSPTARLLLVGRSEERRVGKACVRTGSARWA